MARSAVTGAFGGTNLARHSNRANNAPVQTNPSGTPFSSSSHCNYNCICICICTNSSAHSNAYCSDSPSFSNPVTSAGENTGTSRCGSVSTHSTHE